MLGKELPGFGIHLPASDIPPGRIEKLIPVFQFPADRHRDVEQILQADQKLRFLPDEGKNLLDMAGVDHNRLHPAVLKDMKDLFG